MSQSSCKERKGVQRGSGGREGTMVHRYLFFLDGNWLSSMNIYSDWEGVNEEASNQKIIQTYQ